MKTFVINFKSGGKTYWYNLQKSMVEDRHKATHFTQEEVLDKVNELIAVGTDSLSIVSAQYLQENEKLGINELATMVHVNAVNKGFRDEEISLKEAIMQVVVELGEAIQADRKNYEQECIVLEGKPEGVAVELADAIMLILEECEHHGWDMEEIILKKYRYNLTRPKLHGHPKK